MPRFWRNRGEEMRVLGEDITEPRAREMMFRLADDYEQLARIAEDRILAEPKSKRIMSFSYRQQTFDPEELLIMTEAYNRAYAELTAASIKVEPNELADFIIFLAKKIGLSVEPIVQESTKQMRARSENS